MQAWGLTEPGMVRNQNQDYYLIQKLSRDQLLVIVCDGMGGARSGNIASKMAVEVFSDEVRRTVRSNMKPERIDGMLSTALELANKAVYEQSQLSEEYQGMGSSRRIRSRSSMSATAAPTCSTARAFPPSPQTILLWS